MFIDILKNKCLRIVLLGLFSGLHFICFTTEAIVSYNPNLYSMFI